MAIWVFLVYALAACRLTGLVTTDAITAVARDGIIKRLANGPLLLTHKAQQAAISGWCAPRASELAGAAPAVPANISTADIVDYLRQRSPARWTLAKLITCQWCAGLWIAAAAAPVAWHYGVTRWTFIPALALAFAQVVGMLSSVGRD